MENRGASFIYPVHNRAEFMETTLRALTFFEMDWSESEIIIVDDASTDNLWERCGKYSDRLNLKMIKVDSSLHPMAGKKGHPFIPCYSMNEGIAAASCDYVIPTCPEVTPLASNRIDSMQRFANYPLKEKQVAFGMIFDQMKGGQMVNIVGGSSFWPLFFFGKIRKAEWQLLGGYDESYLPYWTHADNDFEDRMSLAGFTYLFLGEPILLHRKHNRPYEMQEEDWKNPGKIHYRKKWSARRDDFERNRLTQT